MKTIINKVTSVSFVRVTPAIGPKRPSDTSPVIQAAAALRNLAERYRLKSSGTSKKTGHA